jgi:protein gp37
MAMGEVTGIQWTHHTMNPVIGCSRVSVECDFCYADRGSKRLGAQHGLKLWDGDRYLTGNDYWKQPFRWNRAAERAGERRRVFCASYSDVCEDHPEWIEPRKRLVGVVQETPWLDWLMLTKRPENWGLFGWKTSPPNVWAGTTVGVRSSLHRVDILRGIDARVRFLSMEPLLERIGDFDLTGVHWLIVGGESGPKARVCSLDWIEDLVQMAYRSRAKPFVKQLGSVWARSVGAKDGHGGDPSEWPAHLRVREFPQGSRQTSHVLEARG